MGTSDTFIDLPIFDTYRIQKKYQNIGLQKYRKIEYRTTKFRLSIVRYHQIQKKYRNKKKRKKCIVFTHFYKKTPFSWGKKQPPPPSQSAMFILFLAIRVQNAADCHNPWHTFERGTWQVTEFQHPPFFIVSPPVWSVISFCHATFTVEYKIPTRRIV
jgi:hypothetical protein